MAVSKNNTAPQTDKIGQIAQAMLDGTMHYLKGAAELVELRESIGAYVNDPDFLPFVAVKAEIESLPIQKAPRYWTQDDLSRYSLEILESVEWAKEVSLRHCESLAQRYSTQQTKP